MLGLTILGTVVFIIAIVGFIVTSFITKKAAPKEIPKGWKGQYEDNTISA